MSYATAPTFSTETAKSLWEAALSRAALTETFDPREVIRGPYESDRLEALAALGRECVEIVERPSTLWQLKPGIRQHVLGTLFDQGRLRIAIAELGQADEFCRALAETLEGNLRIPEDATPQALGAIKSALQFAAPLVAVDERQGELERVVAHRVLDTTIQSLAPDGLLGRDGQLATLERFAAERGTATIVIGGVGGAGKSALLAEFMRRNREVENSRKAIWLDFDRATLANAEPMDLTSELARQLASAFPQHRDTLSSFRTEVEEFLFSRHPAEERTYSGAATERSVMWSIWSKLRLTGKVSGDEVILILDTVEEILVRNDGRAELLLEWLYQLQRVSLPGIRIVLSGRAGSAMTSLADRMEASAVEIGDIDDKSASDLLTRLLGETNQRFAESDIYALVSQYGGNPLTLTILGRYLRDSGPGAVAELLDDRGGGGFAREYTQNVLYRRILHRIRSEDADLVKLAHPGLILRKVTPGIIKEVLAEPCGLSDVTLPRARELHDALARQVWLVETGSTHGLLVHRRDVRRTMFHATSLLTTETAKTIHHAAVNYHLRTADPSLTAYDQSTEALYHRTFCGSLMSLEDHELAALATRIGSDVDDLPEEERLRLRYLHEWGASEISGRGLATQTNALAQNNLQRRSRKAAFAEEGDVYPGAQASFFFSKGLVGDVAELGRRVVEEFAQSLGLKWSSSPIALNQTPIWQVAIATAGTALGRRLGNQFAREIDRKIPEVEWSRSFQSGQKSAATIADAVKCVLSLFGALHRNDLLTGRSRLLSSGIVRRLDDLRIHTLLAPEAVRPSVRIAFGLLPHLAPDFEKLLVETIGHRHDQNHLSLMHEWLSRLNSTASARRPSLVDLELPAHDEVDELVLPASRSLRTGSHVLRGLLTDVHAPVQAVVELLTDTDLLTCVARLEKATKLWPRELTTAEVKREIRFDRDRLIGTIVEVADRCGMLEQLIASAVDINRTPHAIAVSDMIDRYSKCLIAGRKQRQQEAGSQ